MKVTLNGEIIDVADNLTVSGLLAVREIQYPDMVSVELNGEILDRNTFDSRSIGENDQLELLYFMGGGARGNCLSSARIEFRVKESKICI